MRKVDDNNDSQAAPLDGATPRKPAALGAKLNGARHPLNGHDNKPSFEGNIRVVIATAAAQGIED